MNTPTSYNGKQFSVDGVPREHNDHKPKQPQSLVIHSNEYRQDDIAPEVIAYDKVITQYNATRAGATTDNDWVAHIIGYYREAMSYRMLQALRDRGFDCKQ